MMIIFSASLIQIAFSQSGDDTVYQAQKKLKEMGYDPGPADGIWGKKTTLALKRFQRDHGLPVTGKLDERTQAELLVKNPPSQESFIEAIKKNDIIIVKALIDAGADINARNRTGLTPLHVAALTGQKAAVELLIDKGANINAKNENGVTPLQMAALQGHQSIVTLLKKHSNQ